MPNSRHMSVIASPSSRRATKRRRSSITELSFHGIHTSRPKAKSVTHVSGTKCHPCLRPHMRDDKDQRTEGAMPSVVCHPSSVVSNLDRFLQFLGRAEGDLLGGLDLDRLA